MKLPNKEWDTIDGVAKRLSISEEQVEHYLDTGKLLASIKLPLTKVNFMDDVVPYAIGFDDVEDFDDFSQIYVTDIYEGIFVITRYDRIRWDLDNSCDFYTNDISLCEHFNWEHLQVLKFPDSYVVRKNEIIIEEQSIQRFINKYCDEVGLQTDFSSLKSSVQQDDLPYMNPINTFYSEELATAIDVWTRVFGHNPDKPKTRSYKEDIDEKLDMRKYLGTEAKLRIGILIHPDTYKKGGRRRTKKSADDL